MNSCLQNKFHQICDVSHRDSVQPVKNNENQSTLEFLEFCYLITKLIQIYV